MELDGILGGNDQKRRRERMGLSFDGGLPLAHGFKQARLGARRGSVDLVRKKDVGKHRALLEGETTVARIVNR